MPSECIGSQRENSQPRLRHYAAALAVDTWKAQRLAHAHLSAASEGTRRHCWMRVSRCNHVWIGVPKPVLGRSITLRGRGTRGLFASRCFDRDRFLAVIEPNWLTNLLSTNGTRTSRECAMLAQSVSRSS